MTSPAPALSGQDIGVAARAGATLLDTLLARAGTDFDEWVALRTLSQADTPPSPDEFRGDLARNLNATVISVGYLVDRLVARGWLDLDDQRATLTAAGREFYGRLLAIVGRATAAIYSDMDPADLATTGRVLRDVAVRATAHLATQ